MVASLAALTDAGAAAAYYEADDYYTGDAKAPSRWHGKGAHALGLEGEVEAKQFAAMLKGKLPNVHSLAALVRRPRMQGGADLRAACRLRALARAYA